MCSVGLIPRTLPFTSSNTAIRTFRHAVSLDERRAKFKANLYNRPNKHEANLGTQPGDMPKSTGSTAEATGVDSTKHGHAHNGNSKHRNKERRFEREFSIRDGHLEETDVKEVWFAGCHCGKY